MRVYVVVSLIIVALLCWAALAQYHARSIWMQGDWLFDADRTTHEVEGHAKDFPQDPSYPTILKRFLDFPKMELLITDHDITSIHTPLADSFNYTIVRSTLSEFIVKTPDGQVRQFGLDSDDLYMIIPTPSGGEIKVYFQRKT
jgi:hypothetical protein